MALTGTFLADFSSFQAACAQAEVALKSFETGSGKVETALDRASNALSGVKVVQQATIAAEAVDRIGGVSKLTEAELAKVGTVAQEAADKLRAMGQDVPPKIQGIADSFKNATKEAGGLQQVISTVGSHFTELVSAVAIGNAIANAFEAIGEKALHAAEEGVKVLVDELERLVLRGSVVQDISTNFDRLTESAGLAGDALLGKLRNAAQGTIGDFELMQRVNNDLAAGLHLTQDQFGMLTQGAFALAKVTGGDVKNALEVMNDALVTGKAKALALLTGKIDLKAAEDAFSVSLTGVTDHLTAEGKLEADRRAILAAVQEALQRVGEQQLTLKDRIEQASVAASNFEDDLGKVLAKSGVLQTGVETLGKALLSAFGPDRETAIKNLATAINVTATITVGAIAEISKATAAWLAQLDLVVTIASKIPVMGQNFDVAKVAIDAATKGSFELSSALYKARDAMVDAMNADAHFVGPINQVTDATDGFNDSTRETAFVMAATAAEIKRYEEAIAHLQIVIAGRADKSTHDEEEAADKRRLAAIMAEIDAQIQLNLASGRDAAGAIRVQQSAYDELIQKLDALHIKKVAGISQEKEEQLLMEQFTKQLYDEAAALTVVGHGVDDLSREFPPLTSFMGDFHGTLALGISTLAEYNKAISAFYDSLARFSSLGSLTGSGIGIPSGSGVGLPRAIGMPTRDTGGPVSAGSSYLIGMNRQPEIFTPGASGFVTPLGGGGQSVVVNLTMNGVMATDRGAFQAAVSQAVMQAVKASVKVGSA